jgi:catechol 2,3-dioxygenase-like lactoylglutathione lyase family enzyme
MNATPKFGFVVEYVKDIEESKRFYTDVLGLKVEREFPTFIQFESFAIATDEPVGKTGEPEVYWLVDDIEQAFSSLPDKTDVFLPLKQFPFGKVFAVKGPDGFPCYVLELAKDRPSQEVE